jgi:hypothetical protein
MTDLEVSIEGDMESHAGNLRPSPEKPPRQAHLPFGGHCSGQGWNSFRP